MSYDFAVEYGRLEDYGQQMSQIVARISGKLSSTRVDAPSSAMSGGLSWAAAEALQWRWESANRRVTSHLTRHSDKVKTTATEYRQIEDANEALVRESFGEI